MQILLLEDEPLLARMFLRKYVGHNVVHVSSVTEALAILQDVTDQKRPPFDLVVSDFCLGDGYGTTALSVACSQGSDHVLMSSMDLENAIQLDPLAATFHFQPKSTMLRRSNLELAG